jgi:hypothetical protein
VVPEPVSDGWPVGVRAARQASRRLRQDPRDASPGCRAGLRPGHAAGQGGAHRQQHPADRRGEPDDDDLPGHLRRSGEVPAHRGDAPPLRGELARPRDPGRREDLLLVERWRVVRGRRAHRTVDGGHDRPGRHLHDPGQLASLLRDLRPCLQLDASGRVRRLHPGVLRDRRRPDQRGGLRDRVCLPTRLRRCVLLPRARDLRVRLRIRVGGRDGLRLRGARRRRLGRSLGLLRVPRRRRHQPDGQHQPQRRLQELEPGSGALQCREPGAVGPGPGHRGAPGGPAAGPVGAGPGNRSAPGGPAASPAAGAVGAGPGNRGAPDRPGARRRGALQRRLRGPRRQHLPARLRGLGAERRTGLGPGQLQRGR